MHISAYMDIEAHVPVLAIAAKNEHGLKVEE